MLCYTSGISFEWTGSELHNIRPIWKNFNIGFSISFCKITIFFCVPSENNDGHFLLPLEVDKTLASEFNLYMAFILALWSVLFNVQLSLVSGKQIDGIWHTGIVVFGKEFFFGGTGGIECCPPVSVGTCFDSVI